MYLRDKKKETVCFVIVNGIIFTVVSNDVVLVESIRNLVQKPGL